MTENAILTINTGSSTLKLGLYVERARDEALILEGLADGLGLEQGSLALRDAQGQTLRSATMKGLTQQSALREALGWMKELKAEAPGAVGHRVVHGGPHLTEHQRITPALIDELRRCIHFAPLHIPMALDLIGEAERAFPAIPQFACFDTAFHRTLPEVSSRLPIPRELFLKGIRRYGFHGLSYESIVRQLANNLPARVVIAHLGSGASLAAVNHGESIDTTMGLTPTGGIPMGTRSGDLDPGVVLYLMRSDAANADTLEPLLNHDSGLKALSGGTSDMRQLVTAAQAGDAQAQLAIDAFTIAIAKTVASYAAVLNGLDLLVFSGGIGEHSAAIREDVCRRLQFLGVELDAAANESNAFTIATNQSRIRVCVLKSQEDLEIARHCHRLLAGSPGQPAQTF